MACCDGLKRVQQPEKNGTVWETETIADERNEVIAQCTVSYMEAFQNFSIYRQGQKLNLQKGVPLVRCRWVSATFHIRLESHVSQGIMSDLT